jgi:hypothetical protein
MNKKTKKAAPIALVNSERIIVRSEKWIVGSGREKNLTTS